MPIRLLLLFALLGTASAQAQTFELKRQFPPGHRPAGLAAVNVPSAEALDLNGDGTADLTMLQEDTEGNLLALEVRDGRTFEVLALIAQEPVWESRTLHLAGIVGDEPALYPMDFEAVYGRTAPDTPADLDALAIREMHAAPAHRHYAHRVTDDSDGLALSGFYHLDGDGLKEIVIGGEGLVVLDNVGQILFTLGRSYRYLGLLDAEGDGIPDLAVFDTDARRVQIWGAP